MTQTTGIIVQISTYSAISDKSTLDNAKDIAGIISSGITALAVVIGGAWAYFKFIRGRTYRPRVEMQLAGQWQRVRGKLLLQARITIKNVGSSKLKLRQKGSGLRASMLDPNQPTPPASVRWVDLEKTYTIFDQHEWIESGETICDVVLLDLGVPETIPVLLEGRLVWPRMLGRNIVSTQREIIQVDTGADGAKDEWRAHRNDRRSRWRERR